MNLKSLIGILIICLIGLSGCFSDTLEDDNVTGNYWVSTIDIPKNRMLGYSDQKDGSFKEIVVPSTLLKLKWNENYLLAGRLPGEDWINEYYDVINSCIQKIEITRNNIKPSVGLALDSSFIKKVDILTDLEFKKRLNKDLSFLQEPNRQSQLIWYLFELKKHKDPKIFLSKDSLDSYLTKEGIKEFEYEKEYKN
ncbi:hypothetical protein [uncultured Cyclobacterium sp.]|uniref:hypothetical protein n=1 Tax=uncultured Cyclobacterium sp. TaxID=453820 RepID=UPI0030EC68A2|tara:strand:+ start:12258 stop:12842 length:585 start_codon:yes stop_codon:yes gene_type:complete